VIGECRTVAGVVEVYDDAILNCAEILDAVNQADLWRSATVSEQGVVNRDIRDNDVAAIDPFSFVTPEVLYRFARTVWQYIDAYAIRYNVHFSHMEPFNINRYMPGEQYHAHADAGPGMPRIISAVAYLNDVEEGGETRFVHFDEAITPKAGRIIVFPSNYAYTHAALPPVSGVKYAAAFWTRQ